MDNIQVQNSIDQILEDVGAKVRSAVRHFWKTREGQSAKQAESRKKDAGSRGAVTGGKQMDGFLALVTQLLIATGVSPDWIKTRSKLELPGFYRPTKEWDLLVVGRGQLLAALEAKSQVGPSFGNNFNNRTEEALGTAHDLWTAFREGAFSSSARPWLGYIFLLEDCPQSHTPVGVREPHFKVLAEYRDASYAQRYEIFCRKLVRERQYDAAAFVTAARKQYRKGSYSEPAPDMSIEILLRSLLHHVLAQRSGIQ